MGLATAILAGFFFFIGYWIIGDEQKTTKDIIMTIAGNLIGYAVILIMVVPMKDSFKKWREEVEKQRFLRKK